MSRSPLTPVLFALPSRTLSEALLTEVESPLSDEVRLSEISELSLQSSTKDSVKKTSSLSLPLQESKQTRLQKLKLSLGLGNICKPQTTEASKWHPKAL